jgi:hypothetical protein
VPAAASHRDELALALRTFSREPRQEHSDVDRAIELAAQGEASLDEEVWQLSWHRAVAKRLLDQVEPAAADFAQPASGPLAASSRRASGTEERLLSDDLTAVC